MSTLRTGILVAALGAAVAGLLAGDAATVGVAPGGDPATASRAAWAEVKWPFPLDQWGTGRAFQCRAADCGAEINLYLRAKLGFCNCTTGVADDAELDRVGDLELFSDKFAGLADGRPIKVHWMSGRSRPYQVAIPYALAAHRAGDRLQRQVRRGGRHRGRRPRPAHGGRRRRPGLPQRRAGAALGRAGARVVMKSAVVVFPGINRERDMARALKLVSGREPAMVWHADTALPAGTDLVVVPGGFSYGDYLRCGAIAARAPIMAAVRAHAERGGLLLGVCNGFQILCEAGLLPGVLMRNAALKFICRDVYLRVERSDTPFTRGYNAGQVMRVPVAHGEGNYVADAATIARLEDEGRVLFRYAAPDGTLDPAWNVNGATNSIAGVLNEKGNVLGMMPHPENHVEAVLGPTDGRGLFAGLADHFKEAA